MAEIAAALTSIVFGSRPPPGREGEALGAFVLAWKNGFPTSFIAAFGCDAGRLSDWAMAAIGDQNRYLKLRRIALANLATVL